MKKTRFLLALAALAVMMSVSTGANAYSSASLDNGKTLTIGTEFNDNIADFENDENVYKFTTTQVGYFNIEVFRDSKTPQPYRELVLTLLDSNKNVILPSEEVVYDKKYVSPRMPFAPGTYYLVASNAEGKYSVKVTETASTVWESENNDSLATANAIAVNTTYYGDIYKDVLDYDDSADEDLYRVDVAAAGKMVVNFGPSEYSDTNKIHEGWVVSFLDASGNEIWSTSTSVKTAIKSPILSFKKGTYYVKVVSAPFSGDRAVDCPYTVSVSYEQDASFEVENNDSTSSANAILLNTTYYGNLYKPDDKDYFKVKLTDKKNSAYIKVAFAKNDYSDNVGEGWKVSVCDSKGKVKKTIGSVKTSSVISLKNLAKGTYYIKIESQNTGVSDPLGVCYSVTWNNQKAPAATKISKITSKAGSVNLTWKKVTGANQYIVYRSTNSKSGFKKIATLNGNASTKYVDTKSLKVKKKYYYKVVAVNKAPKKTYTGKASAVKSVTVKK